MLLTRVFALKPLPDVYENFYVLFCQLYTGYLKAYMSQVGHLTPTKLVLAMGIANRVKKLPTANMTQCDIIQCE
jgi:hypothetical protein